MKLELGHIIGLFIVIIIVGCVLIPWSMKNKEQNKEQNKEHFDLNDGNNTEENDNQTEETPAPTEDLSKYNFGDSFDFDSLYGTKLMNLFEYILNTRNLTREYQDKIVALQDSLKLTGTVKFEDYKKMITTLKEALKEELPNKKVLGAYLINRKIQEDKIIDLKEKIREFESTINQEIQRLPNSSTSSEAEVDPRTIKNIKSVLSGINISAVDLGNGPEPETRKIMIALNNGFLTYDKEGETENSDVNSVGYYPTKKKYYVRHGDKGNVKQHFIVKSNSGQNMVITPQDDSDFYICVGLDGVSIEKYTFQGQDNLIVDPKYQWIVSSYSMNGCNKLEKTKITKE
jgi:uncharacterized protein YpmB